MLGRCIVNCNSGHGKSRIGQNCAANVDYRQPYPSEMLSRIQAKYIRAVSDAHSDTQEIEDPQRNMQTEVQSRQIESYQATHSLRVRFRCPFQSSAEVSTSIQSCGLWLPRGGSSRRTEAARFLCECCSHPASEVSAIRCLLMLLRAAMLAIMATIH